MSQQRREHVLQRAAGGLKLHQVVEVEDHVEHHVQPDQHHETDGVVLDEADDDVAIEDLHYVRWRTL